MNDSNDSGACADSTFTNDTSLIFEEFGFISEFFTSKKSIGYRNNFGQELGYNGSGGHSSFIQEYEFERICPTNPFLKQKCFASGLYGRRWYAGSPPNNNSHNHSPEFIELYMQIIPVFYWADDISYYNHLLIMAYARDFSRPTGYYVFDSLYVPNYLVHDQLDEKYYYPEPIDSVVIADSVYNDVYVSRNKGIYYTHDDGVVGIHFDTSNNDKLFYRMN